VLAQVDVGPDELTYMLMLLLVAVRCFRGRVLERYAGL
jgi:hypothetical protein